MGKENKKGIKKPYKYTSSYYRRVKYYLNQQQVASTVNSACKSTVLPSSSAPIKASNNENIDHANVQEFVDDSVPDVTQSENDNTTDDESEIFNTDEESFKEKLKAWALTHKITHSALNDLLKLLNIWNCNKKQCLPVDSRTLLQTPRAIKVTHMGPDLDGQFWYQGLEISLINNLMQNIEENSLACITSVTLNFNVDGLPVYTSAMYQFWPILASVQNMTNLSPFIIGIYYGKCKPNLQAYLAEFVKELSTILKNGIKISSNHFIAVKVGCFICDSPARAFIKGTVNYNHRHGCTKCITEGQYFMEGHHMSFPRTDAELRTDFSFRNRLDEDHHKEVSPLEELPIDLIADFVVADSLHLLELGIMKKCLIGWVKGSFNFKKNKLCAQQINEISALLNECNKTIPDELHRAIRKLDCLKFWKGLEFRTMLLYVGPVLLKDYLEYDVYCHFLMLFCAVTICSSKEYFKYLDIANDLFRDYNEGFITLYGIDSIGSNVHNLCHVVRDVEKFGPLPSISAYSFENALYHIKRLLRNGNRPLAQVAKRLSEYSHLKTASTSHNLSFPVTSKEKNIKHDVPGCEKIFHKLTLMDGFTLKCDEKNKWFMTQDREIIAMKNVIISKVLFQKSTMHLWAKPKKTGRIFYETI